MRNFVIGLFTMWLLTATAHPPTYGSYAPTRPPTYGTETHLSYGGFFCTCNSTSQVPLMNNATKPAKVFLSTSAQVTTSWVDTVNPPIPPATFACTCDHAPSNVKSKNYIITGNQTDAAKASVGDCLGVKIMKSICEGLEALSLFTCDTTWRTGIAGVTSNNLASNDILIEAVIRLCTALAGECAQTIVFTDVVDEVITIS